MPLPELIEIAPLTAMPPVRIQVPGSKSITNRALLLSAFAEGETRLTGALWSEDTQVMVECLRELGFMVTVAGDPSEPANRSLTVYGLGGRLPRGGPPESPLELFVGNAGTATRFLAAALCLGEGAYRLEGVPRMHERPQAALFHSLRALGYRIDSPNDRLPAVIHGSGPRRGRCRVSIQESSQFASALLLCSRVGGWEVEIDGYDPEESPYVSMTQQLLNIFPAHGGEFAIEPDSSSGSYFWAAGHLLSHGKSPLGQMEVAGWPTSGWQVDARFPRCLPLPQSLSRQRDLGDSIMTAIVLAPFAPHPVRFEDLGRLRLQECERVAALRTELTRCGARVEESGECLTVFPSILHGATCDTYEDHRMAMCLAILGLKVPGVRLKNPACVKKTFPNFFQKLASAPPQGLGASVLDGRSGALLAANELLPE